MLAVSPTSSPSAGRCRTSATRSGAHSSLLPVPLAISAPLIRWAFRGDLTPLRPWIWAGSRDEVDWRRTGLQRPLRGVRNRRGHGRVPPRRHAARSGRPLGVATPFALFATETGTRFIEGLTGAVYTLVGSSRLGGFLVFAWFSFWGLAFCVKAAHQRDRRLRHPPLCDRCIPPSLGGVLGFGDREGGIRRVVPRCHRLRRVARSHAATAG